jgi:hypothetical protein
MTLMFLAIEFLEPPPVRFQFTVQRDCTYDARKGSDLSCRTALKEAYAVSWSGSPVLGHQHLMEGLVVQEDAWLEKYCVEKGFSTACTALGVKRDDPTWMDRGCTEGDLLGCGRYAFAVWADTPEADRPALQARTLAACEQGSDLACAAYAEHTLRGTGDLQTAAAWSQYACVISGLAEACATAGRVLAEAGMAAQSDRAHTLACQFVDFEPSCSDTPNEPALSELSWTMEKRRYGFWDNLIR